MSRAAAGASRLWRRLLAAVWPGRGAFAAAADLLREVCAERFGSVDSG